jgi:hypothetical protein
VRIQRDRAGPFDHVRQRGCAGAYDGAQPRRACAEAERASHNREHGGLDQ